MKHSQKMFEVFLPHMLMHKLFQLWKSIYWYKTSSNTRHILPEGADRSKGTCAIVTRKHCKAEDKTNVIKI